MISAKSAIFTAAGATTVIGSGTGVYLLSQDRKIEHKLIREGKILIESLEEYEIAFIERKEDPHLIKALNNVDIRETMKGRNELKAWCEKNKGLSLTKENINNISPKVEKYCTKPSVTIKERYEKLDKRLIADTGWKDKIIALKTPEGKDTTLEADLNLKSLVEDGDNTKSGKALKDWCNEKIKIKLSNDKSEAIWNKIKERCLQS